MPTRLLITTLGSCLLALSSPAKDRPNVILFVTDDQSPVAGCYGNTVIQTPHLDALAADGIRFTEAFATTASCSASRSVILSGLHNHANGQYGHTHHFHKFESFKAVAAVSLPLQMAANGYRTGSSGKYHVAPEAVFHFDHYLPGPGGNPVALADGTKEFISNKDQPFFLYFCTTNPHRGGGTDKTFPGKHKPDLFGNKPNRGSFPGVEEVFYDPKEVVVPGFLPDTPEARAEIAQYYQSCSRVDQGLGRLIELLKEAGQWDNTVLIFTADHGMAFPGAKTTVYEAGLRVPFIVRHPGLEAKGQTNTAMVSHVDLTPTILDLAGGYDAKKRAPKKFGAVPKPAHGENFGKRPKRYHGRSWLPILAETNPQGWDHIDASHTFHEIQMYYPMRVVRDRNYKLIWNVAHQQPYPFASDLWVAATWQSQFEKGPDATYGDRTIDSYINRPQFEFFDISSDPDETRNLADDPQFATLLDEYKSKLKDMQKRTEDPWIMKWSYE
jgi:N-sulfoglucosamine sulfohydrolase